MHACMMGLKRLLTRSKGSDERSKHILNRLDEIHDIADGRNDSFDFTLGKGDSGTCHGWDDGEDGGVECLGDAHK